MDSSGVGLLVGLGYRNVRVVAVGTGVIVPFVTGTSNVGSFIIGHVAYSVS